MWGSVCTSFEGLESFNWEGGAVGQLLSLCSSAAWCLAWEHGSKACLGVGGQEQHQLQAWQ